MRKAEGFSDENNTVTVSGEYTESVRVEDTLVCNGDTTITADVPVCTGQSDTLKIKGNGILILSCTEPKQPCIGVRTWTDMSFGRWSPADYPSKCKRIIVDGVRVVCVSMTPNFSLGSYNYEEYPTIECVNGGSIDCPEVRGKRFLKVKAFPPSGSTKISKRAEYVVGEENLFDEKQKELIAVLGDEWAGKVSYKATEPFLNAAIYLLSLNPECDVTPLVCGECSGSKMIARTMAVLGMPVSSFSIAEFLFEEAKYKFLLEKYGSGENEDSDPDKVVRSMMHRIFGDDFDALSDWDALTVYEMIPSYFFQFDSKVSDRENAKRFFEECSE